MVLGAKELPEAQWRCRQQLGAEAELRRRARIARRHRQRIGADVERRRAARYTLHAPVLFAWQNAQSTNQDGGFTRDLSPSGVYVLCEGEKWPRLGASLVLQVLLPPIGGASAHGLKLEAEARVVRIGGPEEQAGFAALTDFDMHSCL